MTDRIWLQDLTWEEIRDYIETGGRTILLPFGSTEQHGPHLPVGTDTLVAITLAEDAAARAGILAAPPLWFGWSPHHMVLPGTITIRPELLAEFAFDMVLPCITMGLTTLCSSMATASSTLPGCRSPRKAKRELGVNLVIFDPAYMSKTFTKKWDGGRWGMPKRSKGPI